MKICPICIAIALASALVAQASVEPGEDLETALSKLGKPIGTIELRDKTLLLYPQGEVVIRDDRVTEIDLMTDSEFAADQARIKQERAEWQADQERRAALRTEEGHAVKASKLGSTAFAALPAKDRVDYWRSFQIHYPNIDVSEEIGRALESYQSELTELKAQQRIAELEARVAKAEQEATAARLETEKLKEDAKNARRSTRYGLRYYYDPVVHPRYLYRPPTVTIYSNGQKQKAEPEVPDYWKFRNYNPDGTAERVARFFHEQQKQ